MFKKRKRRNNAWSITFDVFIGVLELIVETIVFIPRMIVAILKGLSD